MIKNLLLIGQFNAGALERFYMEGLKKCGISVTSYDMAGEYHKTIGRSLANRVLNKISPDIFYKPLNERLVQWMDKQKYDVILVAKGMELFPETVKWLRAHTTVMANLNADHPFKFFSPGAGNKNVLDSIPYYDIHFSYARNIVEGLKKIFKKDAYCIPFGFNSEINHPGENASSRYKGRVLFVGDYDNERASYLNKLKFKGLDIYGSLKWKTRNLFRPYIQTAYKNRPIFDNEYAQAAMSSTGMINLLRKQNIVEDSHNMRTFEVPGFGGLLISQRTAEQQEYFEEDKEAIYFDSMDELKDKLDYLCKNEGLVNRIKQAGYERAMHSNYSYNDRSRQMLNHLQYHFERV